MTRGLAILLALAAMSPHAAAAQATFYLVRHAEKVVDATAKDPDLTDAGRARAETLANVLRGVALDAIYTTHYARTRQTAAPAAQRAGLEPRVVEGTALVDSLRRTPDGAAVLVVGHSNTIPEIAAALGVAAPPAIADTSYDNLFVVTRWPDGRVGFVHLFYGPPSPHE